MKPLPLSWLRHLPALFTAIPWLGAARGAVIDVSLADGLANPQIIGISAGDTVTWVLDSGGSGVVHAIGEAWMSPPLTNLGASFSHTFTNAGFIAYRTSQGLGTVHVAPSTNSPVIEIYSPIDGFYLPT